MIYSSNDIEIVKNLDEIEETINNIYKERLKNEEFLYDTIINEE